MHIDIVIPWEPGRKLGLACNRAMKKVDDWALILDWDVTLLIPQFYDICIDAVNRCENAGVISCLTNAVGCPLQKASFVSGHNIVEHIAYANEIEKSKRGIFEDVTDSKFKLSGMFLLTRKSIWEQVGGVPEDKFIGMDNYYCDRVKEAGYRIYIMKGLYVYHRYLRQWK